MTQSWIVQDRQTGRAVLETRSPDVANAINTHLYRVWPAMEWLQEINRTASPQAIGAIVDGIVTRVADGEGPDDPEPPAKQAGKTARQLQEYALKELWHMLGATNQVEATQKLKALTAPAGETLGSEWVDHDGTISCPVADRELRVDTLKRDGSRSRSAVADCVSWDKVTHWRVAAVDGWTPWPGGKPPKDTGRIDIMFRKGDILRGDRFFGWNWCHAGRLGDIVGYRNADE